MTRTDLTSTTSVHQTHTQGRLDQPSFGLLTVSSLTPDRPAASVRPERPEQQEMASFKFQSTPFTVESPDVTYTDAQILANYTYETVVVEGSKVRA